MGTVWTVVASYAGILCLDLLRVAYVVSAGLVTDVHHVVSVQSARKFVCLQRFRIPAGVDIGLAVTQTVSRCVGRLVLSPGDDFSGAGIDPDEPRGE